VRVQIGIRTGVPAGRWDCTYFDVGYNVDDEARCCGVSLHSGDEPFHHDVDGDLSHLRSLQLVHLTSHARFFRTIQTYFIFLSWKEQMRLRRRSKKRFLFLFRVSKLSLSATNNMPQNLH